MKSKAAPFLLIALLWLGGSGALRQLVSPWTSHAPREHSQGLAGFFATAGGWANLAADWFWLRANIAWETQSEAAVRSWLQLTLAAGGDTFYFQKNAARILAYDLPAWQIAAHPDAPAAVHAEWRRVGAGEGLAIVLMSAGDDPARWLEAGNLALYAGRDRQLAGEYFHRAAQLPGAPWHAGRIYAQLLIEQGRRHEALAWLRGWVLRIPADDPLAHRELVVERIAELELELRSLGEPL